MHTFALLAPKESDIFQQTSSVFEQAIGLVYTTSDIIRVNDTLQMTLFWEHPSGKLIKGEHTKLTRKMHLQSV